MNTKKVKHALTSVLFFLFLSSAQQTTIVLQNGFNDYNSAYDKTLSEQPGLAEFLSDSVVCTHFYDCDA